MGAPVRLALLAAWCALATALTELLGRAVQKLVLHRYIYLGRQIVWMTPLADLLLFGAVALLLGLLSLAAPRLASLRVAGAVLAFVAAMSVLSMQPWLAWWGMLVLALGFALQAGRLAAQHEAAALRVIRVTLPALVGVVVVLTLWRPFEPRRAAPAGAARPGAPNVLLIVWDVVRAQDLSLYGYARPTTPRLAEFGAGGAVFEHAIAPAPYTLATHASLFTGLWPHQFTATWETPLDTTMPTLAEALATNGYRTGLFSANHLMLTWEHGLLRGFATGQDYVLSPGELARSAALIKWLLSFDALRGAIGWYDIPGRRDASDIRSSVVRWVDRDRTRPFFAMLNLYDAHHPYRPRAPYDSAFMPAGSDAAAFARARKLSIAAPLELAQADRDRQKDLYDGAVAELDAETAALFADLDARGVLRNTLVILAGDHGEGFGEHGYFGHGNSVLPEEVHVPLVMVMPGRIPSGVRVANAVSLRDVPATIGHLLGVTGSAWPMPGNSLARYWEDASARAGADTVLTEVEYLRSGGQPGAPSRRGDVRSLIAWPYQLIATRDSLALFDLAGDPGTHTDLAALPERRALRDSLAAALARWRRDAVPAKQGPAGSRVPSRTP